MPVFVRFFEKNLLFIRINKKFILLCQKIHLSFDLTGNSIALGGAFFSLLLNEVFYSNLARFFRRNKVLVFLFIL